MTLDSLGCLHHLMWWVEHIGYLDSENKIHAGSGENVSSLHPASRNSPELEN